MVARVSILVDSDNISGCHAGSILDAGRKHGRPDVVRVYADAQRTMLWHDMAEFSLIHAGTGKNASDLLLAIDAMELALLRGFEIMVIASSDGDFAHLGWRLRELGKTVIGLGEPKAPQSFRCACSSFVELEKKSSSAHSCESRKAEISLDTRIRELIAEHGKNGHGIRITALSAQMHKEHGTRISDLPQRTWRNYLLARPDLFEIDPKGPEAMVRCKPNGFHKVT